MGKAKKGDPFDPHNLSPQDQLKFEIAQELGLESKVIEGGWRSLTAKESGRIGIAAGLNIRYTGAGVGQRRNTDEDRNYQFYSQGKPAVQPAG